MPKDKLILNYVRGTTLEDLHNFPDLVRKLRERVKNDPNTIELKQAGTTADDKEFITIKVILD